MSNPALFAAVFAALYTAHHVGDHWLQTHTQAVHKGAPGWTGRLACARHVLSLTITKAVILTTTVLVLDLNVNPYTTMLCLLLDAVTHYWIDRRTTLVKLADLLSRIIPDKGDFARLGNQTQAPIGTGAYALDQSVHLLFIFATALTITAL